MNSYHSVLQKVITLKPIKYTWNKLAKEKFGKIDEGIRYGFIAQEMKNVFPEFISDGSQGYLMYNPSGFEAILTAAIKEQQKKIEKLELKTIFGCTKHLKGKTRCSSTAGQGRKTAIRNW